MKASLSMPKGLRQMMEELSKLESSEIDEITAEMLEAGAEVALAGMQRRVPVRSGKLKGSLKRGEVRQDGNVSLVDIGLIDATAEVVRYGTVQEFGSSSVKAKSYLRATMSEDKSKITGAMKARMIARGLGE